MKITTVLIGALTIIIISLSISLVVVIKNPNIFSPSSISTSNASSTAVSNPSISCGNISISPNILVNASSSCVPIAQPSKVGTLRFYEGKLFNETQIRQLLDAGINVERNVIFQFPNGEFAVINEVPVNQTVSIGSCICYSDNTSECHPFFSLLNKTPVDTIPSNWSIGYLSDLCK